MGPGWHLAITVVLLFGLPLALAIHALLAFRRGGDASDGGGSPPRPSPRPSGGGAGRPRPACLGPCLPPPATPRRARVPEPV